MQRYEYKGFHNCNSVCGLDIIGDMVICTQLEENTGTSITNMAEHLATMVCEQFAIPLENLIWIECYPAEFYHVRPSDHIQSIGHVAATYDLVTFDLVNDDRSPNSSRMFAKPKWTRMKSALRRE